MSWLIYALGGGWGHLMRSLALGRIAAQTRPVTILTNSPYVAYLSNPPPLVANCYVQAIPSQATFRETCDRVRQVVASLYYDCLIVDTFPRGLGGELADILPQLESIPRILVHRDLNPEYVRAKDLQRFVAENFDLVLIPGEIGELPLAQLPQVNHTAPWLFKSAGELPNRADARALLRLDSSEGKVVLVCAAGRAEELSFYGQLTRDLANSLPDVTVRCLSAECPKNCPPQLWVFHWPGIDCLTAADVVVGGAGYNTFYECVSVGVPLVAFAFKRQYDRQQMRASRWCHQEKLPPVRLVKSAQEAQIAIADFLQLPGCNPPSFINGAIAAVQIIEYATASLLLKPSW